MMRFAIFIVCNALIFFLVASAPAHAVETTTRLYVPLNNSMDMIIEGSTELMIIKDRLNSTRLVEKIASQEAQAYYPYGTTQESQNTTTDKQFTGHRALTDTDVYHAAARFYNPQLGMFVQADKVEGPNRYVYVNGNPVSFVDMTGEKPQNASSLKDESVNMYEVYKKYGMKIIFPNELLLENEDYGQRFSDPALRFLANSYIQRNPYSPDEDPENFVKFLTKDIYDTSPYNMDLISVWDKQADVENATLMYEEIEDAGKKLNLSSDFEYNLLQAENVKAKSQEDQIWSRKSQTKLAETILTNQAVCFDFTDFTGYVLSKVGIKTAIGGTDDLHHAFGLVQIENTPYVFDTTWGGYFSSFYEDRTGQNEFNRSYSTWGFQTPWGSNFTVDLQRKKDSSTMLTN